MLSRTPGDPLESLKTLRVLAIPEKNGKTEYEVDAQNPEQTITCVHSFFPHSGYSPADSYVSRLSVNHSRPVGGRLEYIHFFSGNFGGISAYPGAACFKFAST